MAGVNLGGSPWLVYQGSRLTPDTWAELSTLGPASFRDRLYYDATQGAQDWDADAGRLHLRGWSDGVVLCVPTGTSDNPHALPTVVDWKAHYMPQLRRYWALLGRKCPLEPYNENIEHPERADPAKFAVWLTELAADPELAGLVVIPAASEDNDWAAPYWVAMAPVYRLSHIAGAAVHCYDGQGVSVATLRAAYPTLPLFITEFGVKPRGVIGSVAAHAEAVRRLWPVWAAEPYIRCVQAFTMPTESPTWQPQWLVGDYLAAVAEQVAAWREARRYPLGSTVPASVGGNYGTADLKIAQGLLNRIRDHVQSELAVIGSIDSDAQEGLDRLRMAGLQ